MPQRIKTMAGTTLEQKHLIKQLHEQGKTAQQIADEVGLSVWTVNKWIGRIKKIHLGSCYGTP